MDTLRTITFDRLFDYPRVQRFINSMEGRTPGAVANDIVFKIRAAKRNGGQLEPKEIYRALIRDNWQIYEVNGEEALYAIDYYLLWEMLSTAEKEAVREQRLKAFIGS